MERITIVIAMIGMILVNIGAAHPTPEQQQNETEANSTGQLADDSEAPWWSTDEMFNNVFPWASPNYRQPPSDQQQESGNDDKYFLRGPDGKDGPMKHIMRVLSILPPTEEQLETYKRFTVPPSAGRAASEVCPLFADPLYEYGQYRPCSLTNITACPIAFTCQLSPVLGAHLCCKDIPQLQTPSSQGTFGVTPATFEQRNRYPWESPYPVFTQPPPPPVRNSWGQQGLYGVLEQNERRPVWAPRHLHPHAQTEVVTTEAAVTPEAIVERETASSSSSIGTPSSTTTQSTPTSSTTTPETSTSTTEPFTAPPITSTVQVSTTSAATSTPSLESTTSASTASPAQVTTTLGTPSASPAVAFLNETEAQSANATGSQETHSTSTMQSTSAASTSTIGSTPTSTTTITEATTTTSVPVESTNAPKQATEDLTTNVPSIIPGVNRFPVQVVQLTVGSMKTMSNGDIEYASTMSLVRDGDKNILVDTGLPTDTNTLIRGECC